MMLLLLLLLLWLWICPGRRIICDCSERFMLITASVKVTGWMSNATTASPGSDLTQKFVAWRRLGSLKLFSHARLAICSPDNLSVFGPGCGIGENYGVAKCPDNGGKQGQVLENVSSQRRHWMKTPAIQNDFSYYRRIVSRQRVDSTENMMVSTELANRMSLFYAHATPMLKVLSEATSKFVNDNADDVQNTTETLGTMAKVCLRMLENPKLLQQIEREDTKMLVLRVMVGLVILYDHVHPVGAFVRGAHVDVKGCVRLLQAQPAIKAEPLLNALRYTTKHLNEENTPKNIRNMLAA
ncbi:protein FAM49B isoform X2 [Drosophila miranda]|uniref:protein FAM49B isoform X2 n=1 Tax=Drosophila miranda TaxID=7229 RepID=UPI0007E73604|nr:protein FAM49B isoform X2 [Drosophila miranda]